MNETEGSQQFDAIPVDGGVPQVPNPFSSSAVSQGGVGVPDVPMPDGTSAMLRMLLEDDTIPVQIKRDFYHVFAKDVILSFQDVERKQNKLLAYDILKLEALNAKPYFDYTFDDEIEYTKARLMYEVRLDRAVGFNKGNTVNERTMEGSQFQESRQVMHDESRGEQSRTGFVGKIWSMVSKRG
jgi:hypothetical protein